MCRSMRRAMKILNLVSGLGFNRKIPEEAQKRSLLIQGLLATKYDRERQAKAAQKLAEETSI